MTSPSIRGSFYTESSSITVLFNCLFLSHFDIKVIQQNYFNQWNQISSRCSLYEHSNQVH